MARLTLEFGPEGDEILKKLAAEASTTKVDVIRRALALYKYAIEETKGSKRRLSITEDNKVIKDILNIASK